MYAVSRGNLIGQRFSLITAYQKKFSFFFFFAKGDAMLVSLYLKNKAAFVPCLCICGIFIFSYGLSIFC